MTVVRTAGGTAGAAGGAGAGFGAGPVRVEGRADGAARGARAGGAGWEFPDQAAADRFLEHARRSTASTTNGFPPAWHSVEGSDEVAPSVGHRGGR